MTTLISKLTLGSAFFTLERWRRAWLLKASTPEPRSTAQEAADARALANRYRNSDPGFASDLYAAADRHESLYGSAPVRWGARCKAHTGCGKP